ncbi:hypothetical protein LSP03_12170 [Lysinibacillus sphaericus]|nr:hypothetical protein LSP03_12170 [Lysinibacillus sphaericus]
MDPPVTLHGQSFNSSANCKVSPPFSSLSYDGLYNGVTKNAGGSKCQKRCNLASYNLDEKEKSFNLKVLSTKKECLDVIKTFSKIV